MSRPRRRSASSECNGRVAQRVAEAHRRPRRGGRARPGRPGRLERRAAEVRQVHQRREPCWCRRLRARREGVLLDLLAGSRYGTALRDRRRSPARRHPRVGGPGGRGGSLRSALLARLSATPPGGVRWSCRTGGKRQVGTGSFLWAEDLRDRAAWVSVERGERDGQRFWLSLIDALSPRDAGVERGQLRHRAPGRAGRRASAGRPRRARGARWWW